MQHFMTVQQVQEAAKKSRATIYRWIAEDKLHPINEETRSIDGGYLFDTREVEDLLKRVELRGLTLREAADVIGVTPQYVSKLRQNGTIQAHDTYIGKQHRLVFSRAECERVRQLLGNQETSASDIGTKLKPYHQGHRLFAPVSLNGKTGRIIQVRPVRVLWEHGQSTLPSKDFESQDNWPERPYSRRKGHAVFQFPMPRSGNHVLYDLLYRMMHDIGPSNMQVLDDHQGNYKMRIRSSSFTGTEADFSLLLSGLIEGDVEWKQERIAIHSDAIPVTTYFSKQELDALHSLKREDEDIHSYIKRILIGND
ncbi:helix-turn-helix domain-containing protein [Salibacterium aidingense]|uniref:helix-turn-helix domain-containing protein n=1 Tax=Salibacterium aidingense TaxID=384933 RepID=UPI00040B3601|nr:helix-turn-helix domain-containing protein [Salibacterium aidingense]